jgi:TonB family protein
MVAMTRVGFLLLLALITGCANNQGASGSKQTQEESKPEPPALNHRPVVVDCDFERFKPLHVGSDWLPRGILRRVEPEYPNEAKLREITGAVTVEILVTATGQVQQVCSAGPPILRQAAERAAFDWLFDTPRLNGKKVPYVASELTFNFVLDAQAASK